MQKKTEGICFAISAGICWGSMGVAAQVLMEDSGFAVGDLVAGRLLGAGALLLMFEHFFMRRSLLKYFSQPGVAKDILLYGVLVLLTQLTFFLAIRCSNGRHRRHPRGHYSGIYDDLGHFCKASRTSDS